MPDDDYEKDFTFEGQIVTVTSDGTVHASGHVDETISSESIRKAELYGLATRPKSGTAVFLHPIESDDLICVGEQADNRPDLSIDGEVRLWDDSGQYIQLKDGDGVHVQVGLAKQIDLIGNVFAGSATATEAWIKGTTQQSALSAWFNALNTFFSGWQTQLSNLSSSTDPQVQAYASGMAGILSTLQTALSTLIGTLASWLSLRHKLDQ